MAEEPRGVESSTAEAMKLEELKQQMAEPAPLQEAEVAERSGEAPLDGFSLSLEYARSPPALPALDISFDMALREDSHAILVIDDPLKVFQRRR